MDDPTVTPNPAHDQRAQLRGSRFRGDATWLSVALVLSTIVWMWTYRVWTPSDFGKPIEYWLDAMQNHGTIKSFADRGLGSLVGGTNPYLGAPNGASWVDFPMSEDIVYLSVGFLSRLTGVVAALNIAFLGFGLLSICSMFFVARRLRVPATWAALAAALFGMSPYFHYRNVQHFNLIIYWPIPLMILVLVWCASKRGLHIGEPRFRSAAIICAIGGIHCNYYLNFFMQLLVLIGILQIIRRQWQAFRASALLGTIAMSVFVLVNTDTFIRIAVDGKNKVAVARSIGETLMYALRPLELFVPGPLHQIPVLARLGSNYRSAAPMTGEFASTFLGIIGVVAFVAMFFAGMTALMTGKNRGSASRFTLFSIWSVWVAMGGGLMQFAQMIVGFVAFRSNNRISIFITAFALLYMGRVLGRSSFHRSEWAKVAVVLLMIFGLWEAGPNQGRKIAMNGMNHWQARVRWAEQSVADRKFAEALEAAVPVGSAVLDLPALEFPELGTVGGVLDYDQFRPYLYTKELRHSYAAIKGRPEARFAVEVASLPPRKMIEKLQENGFSAIIFHMGATNDAKINAFVREIGDLGPIQTIVSDTHDFTAVVFRARS